MRRSAATLALAALLGVATLAVYAPVRHHALLGYDDPIYIVQNPHLRDGVSWTNLRWAFGSFYEANWFPLTQLSWAANYQAHGLDPAGYLVANAVLHTVSALVLLLALVRTTGAVGTSAFVAAVFALHPLHVESVAWASERKDVLSGLFWMLTLLAYAGYAKRPSPLRYAGVAIALALGLLSKPMLVTLPCVLLLLDFWPLGRLGGLGGRPWDRRALRRAVLEKLPLLALAAASSVVTVLAQRWGGAVSDLARLPVGARLANAVWSYVIYLRKAFWPTDLAVFYPHRGAELSLLPVVAAAGLLLVLTALALRLRRRSPYLAVGWLWYLGTLVPVIGLVQVGRQGLADRYTYLPLVGIALALAFGARDLLAPRRRARLFLPAVGLTISLAMIGSTAKQVKIWRDDEALFAHALRVTERNDVAHSQLGFARVGQGRLDEAEEQFLEALRIEPGLAMAQVGLGEVYMRRGELERAARHYARARQRAPRLYQPHAGLGWIRAREDRHGEAVVHYLDALRANPGLAEVHAHLGLSLLEIERDRQADAHFREAIRLKPWLPEPRAYLARSLAKQGRLDEARAVLESALARQPRWAELHLVLGSLVLEQGRPREAAERFREALRWRDPFPAAANNLAWLLATSPDPALHDPREALRLALAAADAEGEPTSPGMLDTLAAAYAASGRFDEAVSVAQRAVDGARSAGEEALAQEIEARLELYREGRSYREGAASDPGVPASGSDSR